LLLVDFRRISAFVELRYNGVLRSSPRVSVAGIMLG
jgi:hypothetical protein